MTGPSFITGNKLPIASAQTRYNSVERTTEVSHKLKFPRRFYMGINYPDLRRALISRGWVETQNRNDEYLDLKFTMQNDGVLFQGKAMRNVFSNHCRGEKCMTCKTDLIETMTESQRYWATWLADQETGEADVRIKHYAEHGVEAFFPRCYIISHVMGQALFFEDLIYTQCESYVKLYIKAFDKGLFHLPTASQTLQPSPGKDSPFKDKDGVLGTPNKKLAQSALAIWAQNYCNEKLIVCGALLMRKIRSKMPFCDQLMKHPITTTNLSQAEHTFILRGSYPASYLNFIKKEDWFLSMKKAMVKHGLHKDKSLRTKIERKESFRDNAYSFARRLIERELPLYYTQTEMNGCDNLWIVKPGGLSRGRNIKIFNNYAEICSYAEIPQMHNMALENPNMHGGDKDHI